MVLDYYIVKEMVLLGDIMDFTEKELKEYRNKIYEAYNEFLKTYNMYAFANFIVWCYEYLESYVSTQLMTSAKMSVIKKYFKSIFKWKDEYDAVIRDLFYIRIKFVHRPFLIDYILDENISYTDKHEYINPLLFYNDNLVMLTEILQIVELDLVNKEENNIEETEESFQKELKSEKNNKAKPVNAFH